ncbi:hypothetical protein Hanom_Chr07g00638981 [Helianthus anomalus]
MPPEYGAMYPEEGATAADAPAGYMTVSMGFFSFCQRDGSSKLMVPHKRLTKWKTKFFYIKATAITARLQFRNVTDTIISENISLPKEDTVDGSRTYRSLMMLGRMIRKARPVVREKSGEDAPLCRMFCPDFKGKVVVLPCEDGEEGFNVTIHDNFRVPAHGALEVELPQGNGNLGALGDPDGTSVPKQHMEKHGDKKFRRAKKPHEPVVIPPFVPEVAGIYRIHLRKYDDYVVVADTLEGLGVLGGGAAAGGSSAGLKPTGDKKRKEDAAGAGGQKGPKLRRTRTAAISQPKPAVVTEPHEESFSFFDASSYPQLDAAADMGVNKEFRRSLLSR